MKAADRNAGSLRIGIVANTSWYIYNFRHSLIEALRADGHVVVAIGGDGEHAERLNAEGMAHRSVVFSSSGMRPWREWATVRELRQAFTQERLDVVLSYTPKGNIYSALALWGRPIRLLMNISGLGTAFVRRGLLSTVARALYRSTVRRASWVFFQNADDMALFRALGLIDLGRAMRIPGSGVDLRRFQPPEDDARATPSPAPLFLMVARLLWDKGVAEFVEAARRVKAEHPQARFCLLGPLAPGHRSGVPESTLRQWVAAGLVEYAGAVDDVRPWLAQADCVVLPSYREGVPRSLLEAAAMARPVIAADAIGCRDAVDAEVSGFLCRPHDAGDLALKMLAFLALDDGARAAMGAAGRSKMAREFDETIVLEAYRQQVARIAAAPR